MRIFNSDGTEAGMWRKWNKMFSKIMYEKDLLTKDKMKIET